jgi:hypothetical protein
LIPSPCPFVDTRITHQRLTAPRCPVAHPGVEFDLQNSRSVSGPAYDLLLVAHVLAGLVGFGAIAIAGLAASSSRRCHDPANDLATRRFFKKGRDWPAHVILLVPVLGLLLLFGGDRSAATAPWPWIGLGLWVVAVGIASGVCWPAERRAQETLEELIGAPADESVPLIARFRASCRRMELATGAISVCFVVAVTLMIVQP